MTDHRRARWRCFTVDIGAEEASVTESAPFAFPSVAAVEGGRGRAAWKLLCRTDYVLVNFTERLSSSVRRLCGQ